MRCGGDRALCLYRPAAVGLPGLARPCVLDWAPPGQILSITAGQQRRRFRPVEVRPHRPFQIPPDRPALLGARRYRRPDPLAPALARLTPRPLRDVPVYDNEPDRLLRQVIRRLYPRRRDEPEVTPAVLP